MGDEFNIEFIRLKKKKKTIQKLVDQFHKTLDSYKAGYLLKVVLKRNFD